ncbi:MAG: hypothetical protein ACLPID_06160 [Beijerinckiaceae bacterium]
MIAQPSQPFGKRGRPAAPPTRPSAPAPTPATAPAAAPLPADLIASIVRPTAQAEGSNNAPCEALVARSLRAAILAGLCVGFFNAALNIAATPASGEELAPLLGRSVLPLPAISFFFGLWSAARTSALSLLVTHRIVSQFGWTGHIAYALGGGAVALAYAAAVHAMGLPHQNFGVEFLTGLGAGFFYRLFAGTVAADEA